MRGRLNSSTAGSKHHHTLTVCHATEPVVVLLCRLETVSSILLRKRVKTKSGQWNILGAWFLIPVIRFKHVPQVLTEEHCLHSMCQAKRFLLHVEDLKGGSEGVVGRAFVHFLSQLKAVLERCPLLSGTPIFNADQLLSLSANQLV